MNFFLDEEVESDDFYCPQCSTRRVIIEKRFDDEQTTVSWTVKCSGFKRRGANFCDKGLLLRAQFHLEEVQTTGISVRRIQSMINKQHRELLQMRGDPMLDDEE